MDFFINDYFSLDITSSDSVNKASCLISVGYMWKEIFALRHSNDTNDNV